MKSTKGIANRQGDIQKKNNTPRIGATMAKRRGHKLASKEDETSQKIDDYLIRKANKVRMILTWKQKTKYATKLTISFLS